MSDAPETTTSADGNTLVLDPLLSPAAAEAVREQFITLLEQARTGDVAATVQLDSDQVSTTALQVLVSLVRMAERDDIALDLPETAQSVLARVEHA